VSSLALYGKRTELRVRRMAPVDFIGRYMPAFFDYAIADEMHELANDTAQGRRSHSGVVRGSNSRPDGNLQRGVRR